MPKICLLTTGLAVGGAEEQVVLLATSLKQRGWNVEVASMLPPVAHLDRLAEMAIPVHGLGMRRGVPDPRALWRLRRILRTLQPEVLHCHMVHANLLGRLVRPFVKVPVVISTAHSIWEGPKWREYAYRVTDLLCDLTTNVSQRGADRYSRKRISSREKTLWVPNGIRIDGFDEIRASREPMRAALGWEGRFVWLAVGNLREPKDYPVLLRAFSQLRNCRRDGLLAIAGSGALEAQLRQLADSLGIAGHVQFLGARRDVPQLLGSADAYVISSAWEGTPMALLEAACARLPIVATSVGGNPEVIENRQSGILVPARNAKKLCEAMIEVHGLTAGARAQLGEAARGRVERLFRHDLVVSRWENIYRQLLMARAEASRQARWRLLPKAE